MATAVASAVVLPSPFIRFCRWSLLFAGIIYGYRRDAYLQKFVKERKAKGGGRPPLHPHYEPYTEEELKLQHRPGSGPAVFTGSIVKL